MFYLTISITPREGPPWTKAIAFGLEPQFWSTLELRWAMQIACDEAGMALSESMVHMTSTNEGLTVAIISEQTTVTFGPFSVPDGAIEEVLKTTRVKGFGTMS